MKLISLYTHCGFIIDGQQCLLAFLCRSADTASNRRVHRYSGVSVVAQAFN